MAGVLPQGVSATFRAVWDARRLYVLNVVRDPRGIVRSGLHHRAVWENDAAELYLSGDNRAGITMGPHQTQLIVSAAQPQELLWVLPGRSAAGVRATAAKTSAGYAVLVSYPWVDLGLRAGIGQVVGVDVAVDTYGRSSEHQAIAWGTAGVAEQNPSTWGQFVLVR